MPVVGNLNFDRWEGREMIFLLQRFQFKSIRVHGRMIAPTICTVMNEFESMKLSLQWNRLCTLKCLTSEIKETKSRVYKVACAVDYFICQIYFNRFSHVVVKFSNSLLDIVAVAFVALFVVAFPILLLASLLFLLLLPDAYVVRVLAFCCCCCRNCCCFFNFVVVVAIFLCCSCYHLCCCCRSCCCRWLRCSQKISIVAVGTNFLLLM